MTAVHVYLKHRKDRLIFGEVSITYNTQASDIRLHTTVFHDAKTQMRATVKSDEIQAIVTYN